MFFDTEIFQQRFMKKLHVMKLRKHIYIYMCIFDIFIICVRLIISIRFIKIKKLMLLVKNQTNRLHLGGNFGFQHNFEHEALVFRCHG